MFASNPQADRKQQLLKGLTEIPEDLVLTPLLGNKAAYRKIWQNEAPLSRNVIAEDIRSGKAQAYGVRTGTISGGVVAVDKDGPSAATKILEMSGGVGLPQTVAFTSGRPGRSQHLFKIPEEYWLLVKTTKYKTGTTGDDGKPEQVELRWNGCQSVLPPSVHPTTGGYRWLVGCAPGECEIANAPQWLIESMLSSESAQHPVQPLDRPAAAASDRTNSKWTDKDWALSYQKALSPSRVDDYDDWLTVGMALHSVDDDLLEEWDKWSASSTKYEAGACRKKWESFKSSGVSVRSLAHMAQQDGWKNPFYEQFEAQIANVMISRCSQGELEAHLSKIRDDFHAHYLSNDDWSNIIKQVRARMPRDTEGASRDRTSNVIDLLTGKRQLPLTEKELDQKIDELLEQNLQPSQLTKQLNLLAKETDFLTPSELKRIYHERLGEHDLAESREERITEVDELLKVGSLSLKLADELPAMYAQPLMKLADNLKLREELYLLALLTALSICHQTGTEVIIHRGQGFSVPLTLFSGIVGESGQRKSPPIKALITKPLRLLQKEAKAEHEAATTKYKADLERWDELKGEEREEEFPDGKPQPPAQQKVFFFTTTSGSEAINRQIAAHPNQPVVYLKDELMGVFTQQGKYSQGRGSEKQDFLSYYDGTGSTELLADGVRSDTETILLAILGSVQPEVLRKFTNNCTDPDGQWARFLWVVQGLAAAKMHDDNGGGVDVTELFAGLYRQVNKLPPTEYTLSRDAFKLYQKIYDQLELMRVNCPDPGLRAVYSKMEGQLGRLVGNCHVIHELALGKDTPTTEIPLARMQQGVRLINFFIEQVKLIRLDSAAAQGELSDVLVKIIQLSQRLGRIKAKHVQMNYKELKLNPDQIRSHFLELAVMGQGATYGNGRKLEWEYSPTHPKQNPVGETVGKVGKAVGTFPTAETSIYQGVEETVGKVGKVGIFSENLKPSSGVSETKPDSVGADTWDCVRGEWLAPELGETDSNNSDLFPTLPTFPTVLPTPISESITAVGELPTVSPTFPTRDEAVQQSALMLVGLADSITSYAMLTDIILGWERDYLHDVWSLLPDDLCRKFARLSTNLNDDAGGGGGSLVAPAPAPEPVDSTSNETVGKVGGDDDAGDDDPDGGGSGGSPVAPPPAPSPGDDGGAAAPAPEPVDSMSNETAETNNDVVEPIPYDPRSAITHLPGKLEVDLSKIDLSYTPTMRVPEWKPKRSLPPYESVPKLYLDLETSGLDPQSDRVLMAGVMDGNGQSHIFTNEDEAYLLTELFQFLRDNQPKMLFGYNVFAFDLNFLIVRCRKHKVSCPFTKSERTKKITASSVHGNPIEFTPVFWRGTSILDAYHQVGITDKGLAIFNSYSLKDVVLSLKLRSERRLELSHTQIQEHWCKGELATIEEYLVFDLEDTKILSDFLFPGVYYQAEIVPDMSIQQLSYDSPAAKWERIYESLYPGRPLPTADEKVDYPGASSSCTPGLYQNCAKIDVNSLYPSLQVRYHLISRKDTEHKAVAVKKYLLDHRLELKRKAKETGDTQSTHQAHALKIIANSGTGFCGVGGYPYNDMEAATLVTAYGIKVLQLMMGIIQDSGGNLIECDTDGIIFNNVDPQLIHTKINDSLPDGISVSLDFRDTDVYVPKLKNYLLFSPDGDVKPVGGFRKRDKTKLQKEFPVEFLKKYLKSPVEAERYYRSKREDIASGDCGTDWFMVRKKIPKGDKALTGAGLGVHGDIVNYYYTKHEPLSKKTGKRLKPTPLAATSGLYWAEHYVEELDKIHRELMTTIIEHKTTI